MLGSWVKLGSRDLELIKNLNFLSDDEFMYTTLINIAPFFYLIKIKCSVTNINHMNV